MIFRRRSALLAVLVFISHLPVFGQVITGGITGGVPVTPTFDAGGVLEGGFMPKTIRYNVGPAVDFRLFGPLRIEVDALYQPFSYRTYNFLGVPTYGHVYGSLWQLPALLKFRIPTPKLKPFVDAGPSVQLAANVAESSYNLIQPSLVTTVHPGPNAAAGLALGGGFEFRLGLLILAPEVRYTHWFERYFSTFGSENGDLGTHLDQVQVLLSIRI